MSPSVGTGEIRAVVGLGNPGPRYAATRHNAGFLVLEELRDASGGWTDLGDRHQTEIRLGGRPLVLVQPVTYMNRSGEAARRLIGSIGIEPAQMLVVTDDVYLPMGRLRVRAGGGTGGHRGLESIVEQIGATEFPRVRVGVSGPPEGMAMEEHVLAPLDGEDWEIFRDVVVRAADAVRAICTEGLGVAMNRFNPAPTESENERGDSRSG